jgi:hypothetical protein
MNMKTIAFLFTSLFFFTVSFAQKKPEQSQISQRIEKIINSQWTFNYFPGSGAGTGYEAPGFDDSRWPAISLPHTWNTFETTGEFHPYLKNPSGPDNPYWLTGWGWYRKHFSVKSEYSENKVFLEFEGVKEYCKVWINGKYIGDHKGGYGSFDFDITSFIKSDRDNLIAIAVNNQQKGDDSMRPKGGNAELCGGITGDVRIVLKDKLFIPMQGAANHEGGTFITTPVVSDKGAIIHVRTWVKNDYPKKMSCTLLTSITDASDKNITVLKSEADISPGQVFEFDQTSKTIKNPHLWSDDDPFLYKVSSLILDGKRIADVYTSPLGFRWFSWNPGDSFFTLNGKRKEISNMKMSPDFLWLGNAIPKTITEMNFSDIAGSHKYNFLRTSYYCDHTIYDLADRHGILTIAGLTANDPDLSTSDLALVIRERIRRNRNHPGIIFWSKNKGINIKSTDDSTRLIIDDRNENTNAIPAKKDVKAETPAQPTKIQLVCKQNKIIADRGSIIFVVADITDDKGIHADDATNTLKWNLTGPATFIGPDVFESETDKHHETGSVWYSETPVWNLIRSTGKPGKIHLQVSASGLVSGTLDIDASEMVETNTCLNEPVLENDGRMPVARIVKIKSKLDDVPREITLTFDDINLSNSDKAGYRKQIVSYITKNNPSVDTVSTEFKTISDLFAVQLSTSNGHLKADDYNFNVDHFNNCRLISGYINSTKLPPLFKDGLKQYYSDVIIRKGNEKNAGDEMNWLNWIPSGGTVVIVQDAKNTSNAKGAIFTKTQDLTEIICAVYPQFVKFSPEARERALLFISKVNPYVHPLESTNNALSYEAEAGQPILIPLLKFISE